MQCLASQRHGVECLAKPLQHGGEYTRHIRGRRVARTQRGLRHSGSGVSAASICFTLSLTLVPGPVPAVASAVCYCRRERIKSAIQSGS